MRLIERLLNRTPAARPAAALYQSVVAAGRAPHWYVAGGVPDTLEGRFDIITAVLAVVLVRTEADPAGGALAAQLTECFVDDMDPQLREIGVGDVGVGKAMGKMVSLLGGRLGAYRDGLRSGDLNSALVRNLYGGTAPAPEAAAHVAERLMALHVALAGQPLDALAAGHLPA